MARYNGYIGNEVLPIGANPFVPTPPTPDDPDGGVSTTWVVILTILGALMIGFLGWALYKFKLAKV